MTLPDPALPDGASALSDLGLIRARGDDAVKFLQGQLTNDVALLDTAHARLAGYCSPKGRLLASFVAWKPSPDEVLLLCSADLLAATLKRLSMFVLRAKCKLEDATAEFQRVGLTGPAASQWLGGAAPAEAWGKADLDGATLIRLPASATPSFLWVAPVGAPAPTLPPLPLQAWHQAEVQGGVARITAATADQFVPQMLNYELVGGVDFKKGCYPGQEIVARSQYRGTVKRRCLMFACGDAASPGQEIFHSDDPGQPAGRVVNAAVASHSAPAPAHLLLAEVKLAALPSGTLHLGAPSGPVLAPRPLPYDVFQGTTD